MMKKNTRSVAALLIALGLAASACGSDDPEPAEEITTTTSAVEDDAMEDDADATTTLVEDDAMEDEDATEDEDAMEDPAFDTVVDIALSSDDFSILVAALTQADLVGTLQGEGPFTVFAPTNAAFEQALSDLGLTAEELLASDDLAGILTYHVVPGKILAADAIAADGTEITTVNGDTIEVTVVDGKVMVDGATVTTADLVAGNGVVHIIDAVILPG